MLHRVARDWRMDLDGIDEMIYCRMYAPSWKEMRIPRNLYDNEQRFPTEWISSDECVSE